MSQRELSLIGVFVASALSVTCVNASVLETTDVQFGGYIKVDAMLRDYSNSAPSSVSTSRQFYVSANV